MRESGVRAHGVSAVDPATRATASGRGPSLGVGPTSGSAGLLIRSGYIEKGRLLLAVAVASEISRTRNHHGAGDADSLISLFPRPFYTQESNGDSFTLHEREEVQPATWQDKK